MTASTDNLPPTPEEQNTKKAKKAKKPKGPFRTGLILVLTLVIVLSGTYFTLFFDSNLRSALELAIGHFHGAETNISNLSTSFSKASLEIDDIQLTDKDNPKQNVLNIGSIKVQLLWDALLRGKFVIDESSIENISLYTPRKSEGEIYPKEENTSITDSETFKEGKGAALDVAKEEFSGNALGDIASILDGTSSKDQIGEIKETLATEQRIKEIEKLADEKEAAWKERLANLPKEDEIKELINKVKGTKLDKNPLKAAKQISDLAKTIKEGKKKVDQYSSAIKELNKDIKLVESQYKSIDSLIEQDIKGLESRFNIPSIDSKSLSMALFSKLMGDHEEKVKKYAGLVKEYLPEKETIAKNKEEEVKPEARGEGVNITFPVTTGYPLFWLKKAAISSKATESGFSGDVAGSITDVTNDPSFIKKPALISLKGDFPHQKVKGLDLVVSVNHHLEKANETLKFKIAQYPVKGVKISNSEKMKLSLKKANSSLQVDGVRTSEGVSVNLRNKFQDTTFNVSSESKKAGKYLQEILNDIDSVYLQAKGSGTIDNLSWKMNSDLGDKVSRALKNMLNEKIANLKKKLRASVEEKISGEKGKLKEKIASFENKYKGKINSEKDKLESKLKELTNSYKDKSSEKTKSSTKKVEQKAKKALKKLFKF